MLNENHGKRMISSRYLRTLFIKKFFLENWNVFAILFLGLTSLLIAEIAFLNLIDIDDITLLSSTDQAEILFSLFGLSVLRIFNLFSINLASNKYGSFLVRFLAKTTYNKSLIEISSIDPSLFSSVVQKIHIIQTGVFLNLLNILSSVLILFALGVGVVFIGRIDVLIFVSLILFYFTIAAFLSTRYVSALGEQIAVGRKLRSSLVHVLRSGFSELKSFNVVPQHYSVLDKNEDALAIKSTIGASLIKVPRSFFEFFAILFLIMVSILGGGFAGSDIISDVVVLAFLSARALPILQTLYTSCLSFANSIHNLDDFAEIVNFQARGDLPQVVLSKKDGNVLIRTEHSLANGEPVLLTLESGSVCCISGESGVGKSTLFKVLFDNNRNSNLDVAVVSQFPYVLPWADICKKPSVSRENFERLALKFNLSREEISRYFALSDVAATNESFSGGEAKRLALLIGLFLAKDILILDETLAGIDIDTIREICDVIESDFNQLTIFVISHDLEVQSIFENNFKLCRSGSEYLLI